MRYTASSTPTIDTATVVGQPASSGPSPTAVTLAEPLSKKLGDHDVAAYRDLQDAAAALVAGLSNELFTATEAAVRGRMKFHAAADDAAIDWTAATTIAGALTKL